MVIFSAVYIQKLYRACINIGWACEHFCRACEYLEPHARWAFKPNAQCQALWMKWLPYEKNKLSLAFSGLNFFKFQTVPDYISVSIRQVICKNHWPKLTFIHQQDIQFKSKCVVSVSEIYCHYSDVIMTVMVSQITCVSTVCLVVCSGAWNMENASTGWSHHGCRYSATLLVRLHIYKSQMIRWVQFSTLILWSPSSKHSLKFHWYIFTRNPWISH